MSQGRPGARKNTEQEAYTGRGCSVRGLFGRAIWPRKMRCPGAGRERVKNTEQVAHTGKACSGRGLFSKLLIWPRKMRCRGGGREHVKTRSGSVTQARAAAGEAF